MQKHKEYTFGGQTIRGTMHEPDQKEGTIPFVIFFHGFTGNSLEQQFLFVQLSRKLEEAGIGSFRFDFLGSGESDGNFYEMTVSKEVAQAKYIFKRIRDTERIDPENIFVVGLSMGGLVASLAASELEKLKGLVLWAPAFNIADFVKHAIRLRNVGKVDVRIPLEEIKDETCRDFLGNFDIGGLRLGSCFLEDIEKIDISGTIAGYKGDAIILHGTGDVMVPIEISYGFRNVFPGKPEVFPIKDADHTCQRMDWRTELFNETIRFITTKIQKP